MEDRRNNLEEICIWMKSVLKDNEDRPLSNELHEENLNSELLIAVERSDLEQVKKWLGFGASACAKCEVTGNTAVHIAASLENDSILRLLLGKGAACKVPNSNGMEPIHVAAWYGNAAAITALCEQDPTLVNSCLQDVKRNKLKQTNYEYSESKKPVADNLIPKKLKKWFTPVHIASSRNFKEIVELLIKNGAKEIVGSVETATPLDVVGIYAEGSYKTEDAFMNMYSFFLERGTFKLPVVAEWSKTSTRKVHKYTTALHTSVKFEYMTAIENLLGRGACLGVWDDWGETPMHCAVKNGQLKPLLKILQWTIKSRSRKVEVRNHFGFTPLQLAAFLGKPDLVTALVSGGADPLLVTRSNNNYKNDSRWIKQFQWHTQKMEKIIIGSQIIMNMERSKDDERLRNGENRKDAETFLHLERLNSLDDMEKSLEEVKELQVYLPLTALHCAIVSGSQDCVKILKRPEDNDILRNIGPLAHMSYWEVLHYLYKGKSIELSPTPSKKKEISIISKTAKVLTDMECVYFMPEGIDLERYDHTIFTAPHKTASQNDQHKMLTHILKHGADLSSRSVYSNPDSTLINAIEKNVENYVGYLEDILDDHIYEFADKAVILDYRILAPKGMEDPQMSVMDVLVTPDKVEKRRNLLLHPLTQTFLHHKWQKIKHPYTLYVFGQVLMTLLISGLAWAKYAGMLAMFGENVQESLTGIMRVFLGLTTTVMAILNCKVGTKTFHSIKWLLFIQNFFWWTTIVFSYLMVIFNDTYKWERSIAAVAVLLSWVELLYQVARYPWFDEFPLGDFFVMFLSVTANFAQVAASFVLLFAAFSMSFMILLSGDTEPDNPFKTLDRSALKTISMLMNFEDKYFYREDEGFMESTLLRTVFVAFFLIMCIPMMNFIAGVAIADVSSLKEQGQARRIFVLAQTISRFEQILHTVLPSIIFINYFQVDSYMILKEDEDNECPSKAKTEIPKGMKDTVFDRLRKIEIKKRENKERRKEGEENKNKL